MNAGANATAQRRWSAERFAQYRNRPDATRVADQYSEWARSDVGMEAMLQLSGLMWLVVAGKLSRPHFKAQLRQIANVTRVPIDDLKIMTKGIEELIRCSLHGSGQSTSNAGGDE